MLITPKGSDRNFKKILIFQNFRIRYTEILKNEKLPLFLKCQSLPFRVISKCHQKLGVIRAGKHCQKSDLLKICKGETSRVLFLLWTWTKSKFRKFEWCFFESEKLYLWQMLGLFSWKSQKNVSGIFWGSNPNFSFFRRFKTNTTGFPFAKFQ